MVTRSKQEVYGACSGGSNRKDDGESIDGGGVSWWPAVERLWWSVFRVAARVSKREDRERGGEDVGVVFFSWNKKDQKDDL